MPVAMVGVSNGNFCIKCQVFDNQRAKDAPDRTWDANSKLWRLPANAPNAEYITSAYEDEEIDPLVKTLTSEILAKVHADDLLPFPGWFEFKTQPRPYQMDALNRGYGMKEFAYFMEMRTGKSKVDIDLTSCYFLEGNINAWLIVVFPGAIKTTWEIQLEEHCSVDYKVHTLQAGQKKQTQAFIDEETDNLKIMVVGVESLSNGGAPKLISDFVKKHQIKFTIDESTTIKNPKQLTKTKKPTKSKLCWDWGGESVYRTILTGTPTTQGIEDLYSQFRFLNWQILGYKSYYTFQNAHCILGGFENRSIIGYADVNKIINKISPYVYQISTEDAIGIPEEVYETLIVEQSPTQKRLLKELGDPYDMSTTMAGEELEVETILERMMRYQQIVGGHFPYNDLAGDQKFGIKPIEGPNPKMDALTGFIETIPKDKKVIIWARFVPEIDMILDALDRDDTIAYRGGDYMTDEDRKQAQLDFMKEDGPRFWVTSQKLSARGIELASASIHIFYSNSFSYDERKQASMRTNSSHQKSKSIVYVDIVMNHKIDKQIVDALKHKQDIAEYVISEIKSKQ